MDASRCVVPRSFLAFGLAFAITPIGWTQSVSAPSPLTLDEAVHLGLVSHPAIQGATADALRARAALNQARAMALPAVRASEEATVSTDPVFAFGTKLRQAQFRSTDFDVQSLNHPSAIANFASSATASWTAFDYGVTQKRIRSARESEQAAQLSRGFTEEQIADGITTLYYRVLLAESQVSTAEANLARAQEIASDIRDRVSSGLALEVDGMRAELAVHSAEDDLAATKSNVRVAREDLFSAIGQAGKSFALVVPKDRDDEAPPAKNTVFTTRLDLRAFDLQRSSAIQNLASIRASAGPSLSTFAQVQSNNPHFTGGGSGNWTVGAKLEISIFDGGARRAREQEASAQVAKIAARKSQTELEANSRMRALEAQIEDLNRRHATATQAIRTDEEALKTARDRYAAGLVPISEVLTEEADLSAAEFDLVRTKYQLRIAQTELRFTMGTLTIPKAGQIQ